VTRPARRPATWCLVLPPATVRELRALARETALAMLGAAEQLGRAIASRSDPPDATYRGAPGGTAWPLQRRER
jgi:hypothetical protein